MSALCICLLASVSLAHADTKALTAEATYIMGDGETPSFAEAMALQKAKQTALEEAGTYVQSYTRSVNQDLTKDEIQTLAGGVVQVEILEKNRTLVGDGLRVYMKIRATVTTDKVDELVARIKGKDVAQEYANLKVEYMRLSNELEAWKQQATKTTQGSDHDRALDRIREGATALAYIQQREEELFQRLVSGKQLVQSVSREKEVVDELVNRMVTSGQVITVGAVQPLLMPRDSNHLSLEVSFTVRVKESIHEAMSHAVEALGGSVRLAQAMLLFSTPDAGRLDHHVDTGERARTRVTLVQLGENRSTTRYFQERVGGMVYHVTFFAGTREVGECHIFPWTSITKEWKNWSPVGRFLPVSIAQVTQMPDDFRKRRPTEVRDVYAYKLPSRGSDGEPYVAILHDEVSVIAQHDLSVSAVNSLTSVQVSMGLLPGKEDERDNARYGKRVSVGSRCR
ncbi:hypothetical protein YTPLAS72_21370 [Nitrospira sp.]|nr:hypothetical protein YTPLAS72_21370 [Nitrospira sp.]